ncbi:hypothetical protein AC1031_021638 [Aphanomyces cochlioides]|nr:hypothetical protein AC1031_021638 [Aphanomyces cochlioides]
MPTRWQIAQRRSAGKTRMAVGRARFRSRAMAIKINWACYDKCPTNYTRQAMDCHQNCPSGFEDQGLFCRKAEYGRGTGYPWKFGDGFNLNKARKRCEKDHGAGNCEKSGEIIYPKCKYGYEAFGCCICRPAKVDCKALGMQGQNDISCSKYVKIGKPHPGKCSTSLQSQAGLCYKPCKSSYSGVGPVCWAGNPSGWVNCGFGAAQSPQRCAEVIQGQIMSVGQLAFNILTEGEAMEAGDEPSRQEIRLLWSLDSQYRQQNSRCMPSCVYREHDIYNRGA